MNQKFKGKKPKVGKRKGKLTYREPSSISQIVETHEEPQIVETHEEPQIVETHEELQIVETHEECQMVETHQEPTMHNQIIETHEEHNNQIIETIGEISEDMRITVFQYIYMMTSKMHQASRSFS